MQNFMDKETSKVPIKDLLSKIIEQDKIWWETKHGSDCSPLIKHGNLISTIHEHFRKLERDYCCSLIEESQKKEVSYARCDITDSHQKNTVCNIKQDHSTDYNSSDYSGVSTKPLADQRVPRTSENDLLSRSTTQCIPTRPRSRHISDETHLSRARMPAHHRHSSLLLHEALGLGRSMSPIIGSLTATSSLESLHGGGKNPSHVNKTLKSSDFDVYRSASRCCHYPVLARVQIAQDAKSESDLSEGEVRNYPWNNLSPKDCSRSISERLVEYLRCIFHLSAKKHRQYQCMAPGEKGKRVASKRENLHENLLSQLNLLETDANPYYTQENFQSYTSYKSWQDHERKEITKLLGGRIPRSHGRHRLTKSKRDRCSDYKELLKKVMVYDLEDKSTHSRLDDLSVNSGNNSASDSSFASYYGEDMLLGRNGRRLLQEFAARYRVASTTQLCLYLEMVEECFADDVGRFDTVSTFRTLCNKFDKLQSLIEDGMPLCNTEIESLLKVTDKFISRIKRLVMTLLTEWTPTTDQLRAGLLLVQKCFDMRETLGEDDSEWPVCVSIWFEAAIIDNYHSCKKPDYLATPWTVLLSLSHAVDVMRSMQKQEAGSLQTDYQAVFSSYITSFPQAVCAGLYEAVMSDVRLLAMSPPWTRLGLPGNLVDGSEVPKENDFVELAGIGLAYKLAEFESLVNAEEIRSRHGLQEDNFCWRLYIHRLSMHWIDVLSCHMRKLVLRAISLDDFSSPPKRIVVCPEAKMRGHAQGPEVQTQNLQSSSYSAQRIRLGSLLRKDSILKNEESHAHEPRFRLPGLNESHENEEDALKDVLDSHLGAEGDSDFDTLEEENSTSVDIAQISRAFSSENLVEETDPSCVLLSYKKLPNEDADGSPVSYYSCTTTDDSIRFNSVQSADTSNRSFHSPNTDSSSHAPKSFGTVTDTSTCIISGSCSSLPQLVQDSDPTKLTPSVPSAHAPGGQFTTANNCNKNASTSSRIPTMSSADSTSYNVSSSLIDVVSAVTRFVNFVRTMADTVYTQPNQRCWQKGFGNNAFVTTADFSRRNEAQGLRELGERFIQKAVQALCEVTQQYANNLLSMDLPHIPNTAACALIGKKLMRQIMNGKYNKTILTYHYTMESRHALNLGDKDVWKDKVSKQMIVRLNNLLALQHGLPDLWGYVEHLLVPDSVVNLISNPSTGTSLPSRDGLSVLSHDGESTTSTSDEYQIQDTNSSDQSPGTSASTHTAIYVGEGPHHHGDRNNNEQPVMTDSVLRSQSLERGSSANWKEETENAAKSGREIPEALCHEDDNLDLENTDLGGFATPFMRCVWDYQKDKLRSHTNLAVRAMDGLFSYQAREWFGHSLDAALDFSHKQGLVQREGVLQDLDFKLTALLNMFAQYIHQEGIGKVHNMLWMQIMQDIRVKITKFRDVEPGMSEIHACHILDVCTTIIRTWYKHPSRPNNGDLDWLVKPIQPSLTLLELYCLPTNSLVRLYSECEEEALLNFDVLSMICRSELSDCRELMLLCMRDLQDRKTFSGEMLHRSLKHIIMARNSSSDNVSSDAEKLGQQMLELDLLKFAFKSKPDMSARLPDLIPVSNNDLETCGDNEDLEKDRTFSVGTGSSQQSSIVSDESYPVSDDSVIQRTFSAHPDYFYKFSQARLPLSVMDDMQQESKSPIPCDLNESFLVRLLLIRSKTDRAARRFLREHGHLPRNALISCFSGCIG